MIFFRKKLFERKREERVQFVGVGKDEGLLEIVLAILDSKIEKTDYPSLRLDGNY